MKLPLRILVLCAALPLAACSTTQGTSGLWHPAGTVANVPSPGPTPLGTPVPNASPDQVVVSVEKVLLISRDTFNLYVHLEKDHHDFLAKVSPEFYNFAELLRRDSRGWLERLDALKRTYKVTKSDFDKKGLLIAMQQLIDRVTQTQNITLRAVNATP